MHTLIAERARRGVLVAIAGCVLVTAVLAAVVWRSTTTRFDTWAFAKTYRPFGPLSSFQREWWLFFSEPAISVLVPVVVVVWAWRTRQRTLAVFAAVAPLVALGVTEVVGKPLVGRLIGPLVLQGSSAGARSGAFPSGHETGTVSWLLVLLVIALGRTRSTRRRVWAIVAAAVWALAAALGLTVNYYHYATDTIGAITLTVAVVLGVALLIDRYGDAVAARLRRRRAVS